MIIEEIGDLIEEAHEYDVILHGCNCQNTMNSGIARALRAKWPDVYIADTIAHAKGDARLGEISYFSTGEFTIVNCYTQDNWTGRQKGIRDVNYEAVAQCFEKVVTKFHGKKIAMPLIGCGLAGGEWSIVKAIVDVYFKNENLTIIKLKS